MANRHLGDKEQIATADDANQKAYNTLILRIGVVAVHVQFLGGHQSQVRVFNNVARKFQPVSYLFLCQCCLTQMHGAIWGRR